MEPTESDELVFFVNGKKITEKKPEQEATLLQYLRRTLLLPGTKEGCGHGGCGSCTVMVSRLDTEDNKIKHYTVNACLFPLCAAHGLAITTVEGVGNPRTGLHEVQKRLIESHGLQCGFCTPGFVMSVFTLLRNNLNPTRKELEKAIEGNLCRCTGYRPIVQAFNSLCQDACPQGDLCCKKQKAANTAQQPASSEGQSKSPDLVDSTQVAIFPAELQLSNKYSSLQVRFKGQQWTWIRATTLDELLALRNEYPDAPVIMGNTTAALDLKLGQISGSCLIYGGGIPSMKSVEVSETSIILGAALTINELEDKLKTLIPQIEESKRRHFPALLHMIERYGADQVRNTATLSGSLMSKRSNSDIITILTGCGASVHLQTVSSKRTELIDGLTLNSGEVITSICLPFTSKNEHLAFYKQSDRRTFSLASLNCCIFVRMCESGAVTDLRMSFGGIGRKVITTERATPKGEERHWNNALLEDVLAGLPAILNCPDGISVDGYKFGVAAGFFYKFFHSVAKIMGNSNCPSRDESLADMMGMDTCYGSQIYEIFTESDQRASDSVHRPIPNVASEAIVSGEAVYVDDIPSMSGELFLAIVTSKRAHARIIKIDPSAALAVLGVHGFIDHTDIKGFNLWGGVMPEEELFASTEVIFYGQPIGAIVAETREIARHASWLVKVEYEDMKSILTIEEAIKEKCFYDGTSELSVGNIEDGFQASDKVIVGEYSTGYQEHFYLEPNSSIVIPRIEFEELEIYVATQTLNGIQENISRLTGVPCNKITCSVKRLGGGFGGKQARAMMAVGPAAVAAQKFKRPVRSVLTREMDMEITGKRHPYLAKYKVGVLNTGKIKALELNMYNNAGSSKEHSLLMLNKTRSDFNGGYKIENLDFKGRVCKTNTPSNCPFRSFGPPEGLLIMEDIIFNIACNLNLPQDKVREVNTFNKGDVTKYGIPLVNLSVRELWEKCKLQSSYDERLKDVSEFNRKNRWRKRGLVMTAERSSIGFDPLWLYQGTAVVNIYMDGTVLLTHGGIEMGQGINTKMIQIASRELGVPTDLIYTSDSNTRTTPNSIITAASMGTDIYGPAVMDACRVMAERLEPIRKAYPDVSWKELITKAFFNRVKLTATGFSRYPKQEYDPVKKTGSKADYYTYGVVCTEVEIDVLTGENQVLQTDIVMDIGKSLNPAIDIGQIEGAFVQGLGMVTSEYIDVDEKGKMINCSPLSYKIPNVYSIPRKFNVTLVQEDTVVTPVYSAKATGEPPLLLSVSVIMAIKEAIKEARAEIGLAGYFRLDSPATVERIRMACGNQLSKEKMMTY